MVRTHDVIDQQRQRRRAPVALTCLPAGGRFTQFHLQIRRGDSTRPAGLGKGNLAAAAIVDAVLFEYPHAGGVFSRDLTDCLRHNLIVELHLLKRCDLSHGMLRW